MDLREAARTFQMAALEGVVQTLYADRNERQFRIDVVESYDGERREFSIKWFECKGFYLQPEGEHSRRDGKMAYDKPPEGHSVWVPADMPWVRAPTMDQAIRQALGFLVERTGGPKSGTR